MGARAIDGLIASLVELRHAADRLEPVPEDGREGRSCSATTSIP